MLGILLIYFIGKAFYDLAAMQGKSQWLFAILGVISYYAGSIVFGVGKEILIGAGILPSPGESKFLLSLICVPAGLAAAFVFYKVLKANWEKS